MLLFFFSGVPFCFFPWLAGFPARHPHWPFERLPVMLLCFSAFPSKSGVMFVPSLRTLARLRGNQPCVPDRQTFFFSVASPAPEVFFFPKSTFLRLCLPPSVLKVAPLNVKIKLAKPVSRAPCPLEVSIFSPDSLALEASLLRLAHLTGCPLVCVFEVLSSPVLL